MTWQYQVEALADGIILEDMFGVLLLVDICLLMMHLVCDSCTISEIEYNRKYIVNIN